MVAKGAGRNLGAHWGREEVSRQVLALVIRGHRELQQFYKFAEATRVPAEERHAQAARIEQEIHRRIAALVPEAGKVLARPS